MRVEYDSEFGCPTTKRFHRTMSDAFGEYDSRPYLSEPQVVGKWAKTVDCVYWIVSVALIAALLTSALWWPQ